MNVNDYIKQVGSFLADCDEEERGNVLAYYRELIEEAEDPAEEMRRLGSPKELADNIRRENGWEYKQPNPEYQQNNGSNIALRVIVLILTSPLWLSGYALIISLFAVLISVYVCFPAVSFAALFDMFHMFGIYVPYAIELFGIFLFSAGVSVLLLRPFLFLFSKLIGLTKWYCRALIGISHKPSFKKPFRPMGKGWIISGSSALVMGILIIGGVFAFKPDNKEYFNKIGVTDLSYTFESTENLDIDIEYGKIEIIPADSDKIEISAKNVVKDRFSAEQNDTVSVLYKTDTTGDRAYWSNIFKTGNYEFLNIKSAAPDIKIYVPEKEYNKITLKAACGDIDITDIKTNFLNIECNLGDVEVNGITANDMVSELDCGNLNLTNCTVYGKLNGVLSLGNAEFDSVSAGYLDIENDCGDIEFSGKVTNKEQISNVDISLGECTLELEGDDYCVKTDVDLGDVDISCKDGRKSPPDNGDIIIKVNNSCGDIDIIYK